MCPNDDGLHSCREIPFSPANAREVGFWEMAIPVKHELLAITAPLHQLFRSSDQLALF